MLKFVAQWFSRRLSRRQSLMFQIQRSGLHLAWKVLDLDAAAWVVRRPEWLRAKPDPKHRLLPPSAPPACLDPVIAARIQSRYRGPLTMGTAIGDGIWEAIRETHLGGLTGSLLASDPQSLTDFATNIFRTSAVNGFSYGSTFDRWPHRWNYLPLQIELSAVTLAEYLGVLRLECPEQGPIAGWRRQLTPKELMDRLEERLGFRIEHPRCGNPRGIDFGGRFLARETCSQIYTAHRMIERIDAVVQLHKVNVVEIGGGYGGLCFWLRRLLGSRAGRYAIIDLPEISAIQATFLSQALDEAIALPDEAVSGAPVQLVLNTCLAELDFAPDVVINQDSLPEMPEAIASGYLAWVARSGTSLFLSFNQEAYAENVAEGLQNWVSALAGGIPNFRRVSRELSWDRRGYLEETYLIDPA